MYIYVEAKIMHYSYLKIWIKKCELLLLMCICLMCLDNGGSFIAGSPRPTESKVDYTGHVVLRLHPKTPGDFHLIWNLSQRDYLDLEIWGDPMLNHSLDIRVPPQAYSYITRCFTYYRIKWKVEIPDLQSLIDAQFNTAKRTSSSSLSSRSKRAVTKVRKGRGKRRKVKGKRLRYLRRLRRDYARRKKRHDYVGRYTVVGQYVRYRQIRLWMQSLELSFPKIAKVVEIGRTYENRPLELMKIGSAPSDGNTNKSAIWIDGGIHSREWIAPATVTYIIEKLLLEYGKDELTTKLIDTYDWYILPVANPDGYEYSHTVDRLWRKTRSRPPVTGYFRCLGVDMNRNFGFKWKGHCDKDWIFLCGSSNPCQSTYAGEVPFSEPEVRAMAEEIYKHRQNIKMYLSLHSYSQLWLTPWGYTVNPPKDKIDLMNMANKGMEALMNTHGTRYVAGSPATILYAAGGGSYDWAKAVAGIKYSYTLELRDRGRYGFLLPQQYIHPVGEETWNAVKVVATELLEIENTA